MRTIEKTTYAEDTSREHTALRAALKSGSTGPQFGRRVPAPIPVPRDNNIPWTAGEGDVSIQVGGLEAEAEHMSIDSDDIANHDFPLPPPSEHRNEGRVTEATGKTKAERVQPGGKFGQRPGDHPPSGFAPTIMDQNKAFASQDGDAEPQNDIE